MSLSVVHQLYSTDCGVAAVATVARVDHAAALVAIFGAARKRSFRTRMADLRRGLTTLGIAHAARPRRCSSFEQLEGTAIVGVNRRLRGDWHWVVFCRTAEGPIVLDPARGPRQDFGRLRPFTALPVEAPPTAWWTPESLLDGLRALGRQLGFAGGE